MKLLPILHGRLSDISFSCLSLFTKVIIVFKNIKIYSFIFIIKIFTKFANKFMRPLIKKQL